MQGAVDQLQAEGAEKDELKQGLQQAVDKVGLPLGLRASEGACWPLWFLSWQTA